MVAELLPVMVLDLSGSRRRDAIVDTTLREDPYQTTWIRTLPRAEELVRKGAVRFVLLVMPRRGSTSPESVLNRLEKANEDVPVIVVSAKPSLKQAIAAVRGRARDYLPGPFDREDLEAVIDHLIEERGYLRPDGDALTETVGQRLRKARLGNDLTLKRLSTRTGLSPSLISQIELARTSASVATLQKLSRALRIHLSEIFAGF